MRPSSRRDRVDDAFYALLKRRNFQVPLTTEHPPEHRRDFPTSMRHRKQLGPSAAEGWAGSPQVTPGEAMLRLRADSDGGVLGTSSLSSIHRTPEHYQLQLDRLVTFLQSKSCDSHRKELMLVLCPLFVHMYTDMLVMGGLMTEAHTFLETNQDLFMDLPSFQQMISRVKGVVELCASASGLSLSLPAELENLRLCKQTLSLSEEAFQLLVAFLRDADNMVVFQIFNRYLAIHISIDTGNGRHGNQLFESSPSESVPPRITPAAGHETTAVRNLRAAIAAMRDTKPSGGAGGHPPDAHVLQYSLINAWQGVCDASLSADGRRLAAAYSSSAVQLWDLKGEKMVAKARRTGEQADVWAASCDPSRVTLTGDLLEDRLRADELIRRGEPKETITMKGHSGVVYKVCFTRDSQWLMSASEDKTVRLWSLETFTNVVRYVGHTRAVWSLDLSPLGSHFVTGSNDHSARLWTTDRIHYLRMFPHAADVDAVKFHPGGNMVATATAEGVVRLWDVHAARCVRSLAARPHDRGALVGNTMALAFTPDGSFVAAAGDDAIVRVWDVGSGRLVHRLKGHTDTLYYLDFSPDGKSLCSGGLDCIVKVWDLSSLEPTAIKVPQDDQCSGSDAGPTSRAHSSYNLKAKVFHLSYEQQDVIRAVGAADC